MNEHDFHEAADVWLDQLFELLESEDAEATLDLEYDQGTFTIVIDEQQQLIVNKDEGGCQMVMTSPASGMLEFDAVDNGSDWVSEDGRRLSIVLSEELHYLTGERFTPNVV